MTSRRDFFKLTRGCGGQRERHFNQQRGDGGVAEIVSMDKPIPSRAGAADGRPYNPVVTLNAGRCRGG